MSFQNLVILGRRVVMSMRPSKQSLERLGTRWLELAKNRSLRLSTGRRGNQRYLTLTLYHRTKQKKIINKNNAPIEF